MLISKKAESKRLLKDIAHKLLKESTTVVLHKMAFKKRALLRKWASLVAQLVKNPPAMWETQVRSLGWEDPLEKGMATHSSILAREFRGQKSAIILDAEISCILFIIFPQY